MFYARQRAQDLLTQMAVTVQRLVVDQITALNTTTANIIDSTSKLLKDNTARIHEQAASSTIPTRRCSAH